MSRRNSSPNTAMNREEPFPSNPTRPTRIGLYMTNPKLQSWHYAGFWAKYAAAIFLDEVQNIQGPFALENDDMYFDTGWVVSMRGMQPYATIKDLLKYQPTREEEEWKIPDNMIQTYRILRNQTHDKDDIPKVSPLRMKVFGEPKLGKTKPEKLTRIKTEGHITIAQLAQENGIDPSKARKALRTHNIEKPYEWPSDNCAHIVDILKKACK